MDALYGFCADKVKNFLQPILDDKRSDIAPICVDDIKQALYRQYHDPQLRNSLSQQLVDLHQITTFKNLMEIFEELTLQLDYPIATGRMLVKPKLK